MISPIEMFNLKTMDDVDEVIDDVQSFEYMYEYYLPQMRSVLRKPQWFDPYEWIYQQLEKELT